MSAALIPSFNLLVAQSLYNSLALSNVMSLWFHILLELSVTFLPLIPYSFTCSLLNTSIQIFHLIQADIIRYCEENTLISTNKISTVSQQTCPRMSTRTYIYAKRPKHHTPGMKLKPKIDPQVSSAFHLQMELFSL